MGSTFHNGTNAKPWGDGRWAFRRKSYLAKGISSPFPKNLWTGGGTKTDQFSEKFQTALPPPPIFGNFPKIPA